MYEYISGEIAELTPTYVVIDAGGVGYYINISLTTYAELETHKRGKLFIHYIVREDAQIFYGFATKHERELFRLLIGVSGVGGNTARMILSTYAPAELGNIISTENAALLKNVKGLGVKTAQKIIVEIKDKITGVASKAGVDINISDRGGIGTNYEEAMAALTMLGFPRAASDKVIRTIIKDSPSASVEDIVRMSLKKL